MKRNPTKWSLIAAGVAIVGVIGTAVFTALETPLANYRMEEAKKAKENEEQLTAMEKAKVIVPSYKKAIAAAAVSITAIILSNRIDKKVIVGLAGLAASKDIAFRDFKTATKKIVGEETYADIVKSIAEGEYESKKYDPYAHNYNWISTGKYKIFEPGEGKQAYYLEDVGCDKGLIYMKSEDFLRAKYHFNRNFSGRGCALLSEFMAFCGYPDDITKNFDYQGWNIDQFNEDGVDPPWVDFYEKEVIRNDGSSLILVSALEPPIVDPENYWENTYGGKF